MNNALFANPQLFQAYQQDPGLAYGQALMQQGASTAPVRSPLEGLARALTAGVGGYTQSKVRDRYQAQDESYQKGLAAALQGGDVLGALSASDDPTLKQMGLQAQIQRAMQPGEKDTLVKVYDPQTKTERYVKQSQAAGMQSEGPQMPKVGDTRKYRAGPNEITEQWDGSQWAQLGQGPAFAPPNQVNVNTKTESAFGQAFGKGEGEAASALANDVGNAASSQLQQLDAMKQAVSELQAAGQNPGALAGLQTKATQLMQGLNLDPKALGLPANAGPAELISAISNKLALEARNPAGGAGMPGAMSDADRNFLAQTVPNLGDTPQGMAMKIDVAQKVAQRKSEMSAAWNSYPDQSQDGWSKFKQDWKKHTDTNPLFSASNVAPAAAPKAPPAPVIVPSLSGPGWN